LTILESIEEEFTERSMVSEDMTPPIEDTSVRELSTDKVNNK
jgi:hypothetical protein